MFCATKTYVYKQHGLDRGKNYLLGAWNTRWTAQDGIFVQTYFLKHLKSNLFYYFFLNDAYS